MIFFETFSILQIAIFCQYYKDYSSFQELMRLKWTMIKSPLIFDPDARSELWRFFTYQYLHAGLPHLLGNVIMQLLIGIPLEMVHGTLRVGIIYTVGSGSNIKYATEILIIL